MTSASSPPSPAPPHHTHPSTQPRNRTLSHLKRTNRIACARRRYGRLSLDLKNYSSIVLVAGGIGFTPIANTLGHLLAGRAAATGGALPGGQFPRLESLTVIWVCKSSAAIATFNDLFESAMAATKDSDPGALEPPLDVKLELVTTREAVGTTSDEPSIELEGGGESACKYPIRRMGRRPDMTEMLTAAVGHGTKRGLAAAAEETPGPPPLWQKTAMVACGPTQMMHECEAVAYDTGCDVHVETFHF